MPVQGFHRLIPNFDSRYMLGVSGTTGRKDRLSRLIYYYLGDVVYTIDEKDAREGRGIIYAHIVARPTEFEFPYQSRADYPEMLQALMRDRKRTRIIADDIEAELRGQNRPWWSCRAERNRTRSWVRNWAEGDRGGALRERGGVADGRSGGNGFVPADARAFETGCRFRFAANPCPVFTAVQHAGALSCRAAVLSQEPGRCGAGSAQERRNPDERARIYDYVDRHIGLLENFFRMRSYNYGVHPDVLLDPGMN